MKIEALLFGGVALFFAGSAALYAAWSGDPAGTAVLIVAFGMAGVISFFCAVQYRRRGRRPQDRTDAEVADAVGHLEFFPPHSPWLYRTRKSSAGRTTAGSSTFHMIVWPAMFVSQSGTSRSPPSRKPTYQSGWEPAVATSGR
ncbi:aa3-type cytochrome oxidase subunit IV [Streptomyces sp. NPDC004012]